jgi:hypothetical protein
MPSKNVMPEWKAGKLHSGSKKGPVVKNQKQAVAIMLSEQKNESKHGGTYVDSDEQPQRLKKPTRSKR